MKRTLQLVNVLPLVIILSLAIPAASAQASGSHARANAHRVTPDGAGSSFGAAQTSPAGYGGASQSIAADLNGDGIPDLAVVNPCDSSNCTSGSASVAVLIGNGDGSFQAPVIYATGSFQPMSIAAGDFNGDGALDLVVASQCPSSVTCGNGQVSVLLGNGDGTFQSPVPYSTGSGASYFVITEDFDGDGNLDLAVANQSSGNGTVAILLGNGDGTFQSPVAYSTGAASASFLAVGDFNMDGAVDIVAINGSTQDCISILLNNGAGAFLSPAIYAAGGAFATAAAVADLNGDGIPDIAVVNQCATYSSLACSPTGSIGILLGNGDGTFAPPVAYGSAGNQPGAVAIADFNGDGNPDLVVANLAPPTGSGDGLLSLLLGNGDGTFQPAATFDAGAASSAYLSAADFNGDGQPDVAVISQCPSTGACSNSVAGVLLNTVSIFTLNATSTALISAANPAVPNQAVLLTATVTAPSGSTQPTGTVTFYDGSAALSTVPVSSGQATYTASFSSAGPHGLQAIYSGDSHYAVSASVVLPETVGSVMTLGSSVNPSALNQSVTFTAIITRSGPLPSGSIKFMDGATVLGTVPLTNNHASFVSSSLTAGNHNITASYAGDSNYQPGSAVLAQAVSQATSITLTSSANPSSANQPVTFTAAVTAASGVVNSGAVAFLQGGATWGTAPVVNGQASILNSFTHNNTYPISAVFLGSPIAQGSTSSSINQVVSGSQSVSTATTLIASVSPSYVGQPVTFTATVTPQSGSIPDGETVTFYNGGNSIGTGPTSGGVAMFTTSALPLGTDVITATYPGDSTYLTSTSRNLNQSVKLTPTNTNLTSTLNPAVYGQSVTFNVTVTPQAGTGTPTGSVSIKNGGSTLGSIPLSNGSGSLTTSALPAGTLSITANYGGDTNFASGSANLSEVVNMSSTTTTLTSSPNPSSLNQSVALTATVTGQDGGKVAGTVTFTQGSTTLGSASPVLGKAGINYTFTSTGTFPIVATYSGDANDTGSSSQPYSQTVGAESTTTTLATSGTPSFAGQTVTFTATVSPTSGAIPNGETVTFYDGSATLGTGSTANGVAAYSTSALQFGKHSITATYAGDATYQTSTSKPVTQVVSLNTSATALVSDSNPASYGQPVTLTATVTATSGSLTPTGKVTFKNGSATLTSVNLVNGIAAYTTSSLPPGSLAISASYGGDSNFSTSSGSLTQVITQAVSSTALASNHNPASFGEAVKFTATVTAQSSGAITGSVNFLNGTTLLGSASLLKGVATFSYTFTAAGTESITAAYQGDTDNKPSTSSPLSQVVNVASTTTTVTSNAPTAGVGQAVTLTATVTSPYGSIPNGELVTFYDGGNQIGTGNTASGAANFTTSTLTSGVHQITATYAGDVSFAASTSRIFQQTINAASTTTTVASSANPATYGLPIAFTATVASTGSTPTGTVTFKNGTASLGVATLNANGAATLTTLTLGAGAFSITASYSGDAGHAKSTSAAVNQVVSPAVTTTQLVSSVNPSAPGESVSFTAIVRSTTAFATGSVTFTSGSTTLGSATLVNGTAKLALTTLPTGATTVTATYPGTADIAASSASTVQYVQ